MWRCSAASLRESAAVPMPARAASTRRASGSDGLEGSEETDGADTLGADGVETCGSDGALTDGALTLRFAGGLSDGAVPPRGREPNASAPTKTTISRKAAQATSVLVP